MESGSSTPKITILGLISEIGKLITRSQFIKIKDINVSITKADRLVNDLLNTTFKSLFYSWHFTQNVSHFEVATLLKIPKPFSTG